MRKIVLSLALFFVSLLAVAQQVTHHVEGVKDETKMPRETAAIGLRSEQESREWLRQVLEREYERSTLLRRGDRAADFTAARFGGDSVSLAQLRGKVVLINFWATWCGPCLAELEGLPKAVLARFEGDPGFVFLPVAYTDSAATLSAFFTSERGKTTYAYLRGCTAMDPDKSVFSLFATKGVPRTVVVGRDGVILYGSVGNTPEGLEAAAAAISEGLRR